MVHHIAQNIYEAISFDKGKEPNYSQLTSYFISEGLFINNKGDEPMVKSVEGYVSFVKTLINSGNILSLNESEISSDIQLFGKVGTITSRYKLEFTTSSGNFTRYGVNLFQVIKHHGQWLVASMCWDDKENQELFTTDLH